MHHVSGAGSGVLLFDGQMVRVTGVIEVIAKVALLVVGLCIIPPPALAETFKFIALGDMPYGDKAQTHLKFRSLIDEINTRRPAFSIHVGDFKSGATPCSDAMFQEQLDFMNTFQAPLIYTPGDNEWTDCHRPAAGRFDPLERLAKLRAMFFGTGESLGTVRMPIERQGVSMPEYKAYVENARFAKAGVQFATLHVVGSNNGFEPRDRKAASEFFDRDQANLAWLVAAFAKAKTDNAIAVVIAMQADMFEFDFGHFGKEQHLAHSGFLNVSETLQREAAAFARPVLLIYGDSHNFRVHTPFRKRAPQLLGLEVFGADQMHAVEITVDTNDPGVFSYRPIWNPSK